MAPCMAVYGRCTAQHSRGDGPPAAAPRQKALPGQLFLSKVLCPCGAPQLCCPPCARCAAGKAAPGGPAVEQHLGCAWLLAGLGWLRPWGRRHSRCGRLGSCWLRQGGGPCGIRAGLGIGQYPGAVGPAALLAGDGYLAVACHTALWPPCQVCNTQGAAGWFETWDKLACTIT